MALATPLLFFEGFLVILPVLAYLLKQADPPAMQSDRDNASRNALRPLDTTRLFMVAWVLCLIFYSLEYASRSAPSVMIPELSKAFKMSAVGVAALLGTYYYTYSATSLIAGAALDRFGAKLVLPVGFLIFGVGCILFQVPVASAAYVARLCQGAGSAFAFTGAVSLASRAFPPRWLGTAVGITQSLGMAGGFAGQFAVGPAIMIGFSWQLIWLLLGTGGLVLAVLVFIVTPGADPSETVKTGALKAVLEPYRIVFSNPQSYVCGATSGLLFAPTTVGGMTWGVVLFQRDRGLTFSAAVTTAAMITLGWIVGSPLMGWLADRSGHRVRVLRAGMVAMALVMIQIGYLPQLSSLTLSCFLFGVFSGVAMIPYSIIKEVNPDQVKGSATGAMNFITFGFTALIAPLFGDLGGDHFPGLSSPVEHFRATALFWVIGISIALLVTLRLRGTGSARVSP